MRCRRRLWSSSTPVDVSVCSRLICVILSSAVPSLFIKSTRNQPSLPPPFSAIVGHVHSDPYIHRVLFDVLFCANIMTFGLTLFIFARARFDYLLNFIMVIVSEGESRSIRCLSQAVDVLSCNNSCPLSAGPTAAPET